MYGLMAGAKDYAISYKDLFNIIIIVKNEPSCGGKYAKSKSEI